MKGLYKQLLAKSVMKTLPPPLQSAQDSPLHTLHFVVNKNYAALLQNDQPEEALDCLRKAVIIDNASSSTWYQLGMMSLSLKRYPLACFAFERALDTCQNKIDYSKALKGASEATFEVGDFVTCSSVVARAIEVDSKYELGKKIMHEIQHEADGKIPAAYHPKIGRRKQLQEPKKLDASLVHVSELSLTEFGNSILELFKSNDCSFGGPANVVIGHVSTKQDANEIFNSDIEMGEFEPEVTVEPLETEGEDNFTTAENEEDADPEEENGEELDESETSEERVASPTKRRKRFRDLESRASKRIKEEKDMASSSYAPDAVYDSDLVSDEDFFNTIDELLPPDLPFNVRFAKKLPSELNFNDFEKAIYSLETHLSMATTDLAEVALSNSNSEVEIIDDSLGTLDKWWSDISLARFFASNLDVSPEWTLRMYWLHGRMEEYSSRFQSAVKMYNKCFELLIDSKVFANDTLISSDSIKKRLQSLALEQHLREAEAAFSNKNYRLLLDKLHGLVFQDNSFPQWFSSIIFPDLLKIGWHDKFGLTKPHILQLSCTQQGRILTMLEKAYEFHEMDTERFICQSLLLISEIKSISANSDIRKRIEHISKIIEYLLNILELNHGQDEFSFVELNADFFFLHLFRILKDEEAMLSILDFMGYSNSKSVFHNFVAGAFAAVRLSWIVVKACGESKLRKDRVFIDFSVRSWSLMFYLYKSFEDGDVDAQKKAVDSNSPLLEHNNAPHKLTQDIAAEIFSPISKYVKRKLAIRNFRAITNDIRDTVDAISEMFPEPPWQNAEIAYNRTAIDSFLVTGICKRQKNFVNTLVVRSSLPYLDVYKDMFFVRGKFSTLQKRVVIGLKTKKSFENLENVVTDYLFNLYLNPYSGNAWLLMAEVFNSLSEEYLSWSASDILSNLELIREYQLKSYRCYEQVHYLLKTRKAEFHDGQCEVDLSITEEAMRFYGNCGYLCYSIIVPPMAGLAVKSTDIASLAVWSNRCQTQYIENNCVDLENFFEENASETVILRGIECFMKAKRMDGNDWRFPFMVGKMMKKLKTVDPFAVVKQFCEAISLVPQLWTTKEQERILDAHYCLISYLCKGLYTGKFERHSISEEEVFESQTYDDLKLTAFDLILTELSKLKSIDKKKWQHRPYWKSERAKNELLTLFQLRSNARSFFNFWRPEFERPGRHFVYIHKYTVALIGILHELKDLESLRHLVRKTQKAYDTLLYPQTVWRIGFEAMTDLLSEKIDENVWMQFVNCVPQKDFLSLAPSVEKKMLGGAVDDRSEDANLLQTAFTLKKLNENLEDETVLSRILVLLYCKLFLANMDNPAAPDSELQIVDTSIFFTLVLRRCLVACKVPWSKKATVEDAAENGAEAVGVSGEPLTNSVLFSRDVDAPVVPAEESIGAPGNRSTPEPTMMNSAD
ncbi:Histone transcription regulator 3 [Entophlyctis luteolus]|nr:Histone transcription regulator 3 [Entophlyctis luteolus]